MKKTFTLLFTILLVLFLNKITAQNLWPDYAGKQSCQTCHQFVKPIDFAEFEKSGHPWKIQKIDRSKVDANGVYKPFPAGTNEEGVPLAPEVINMGYSYLSPDTNIGFLIGGFGWKARWMNKDGYIYEGTKAQYNLGTIHPSKKGHGGYNASYVNNQVFALRSTNPAVYNCGACHTTGWKAYDSVSSPYRYEGRQGFAGTFFEFGVQCEGCHGPSKAHTQSPSTVKPPRDGFEVCKPCHARGKGLSIPVKSNKQFLDHREQYDQMLFSKHRRVANMKCTTCHDPHKSTVYDRGGLKPAAKTCNSVCHTNMNNVTVTILLPGGGSRTHEHKCNDCHMAYIGETAVKDNNNRGDQASHMWKINVNPVTKFQAMFDTVAMKVIIPPDSIVSHTLDFACLGCHTTRDINWAAYYADDIHSKTIVVSVKEQKDYVPSAYYLSQNYPNPFNAMTTIKFGLPEVSEVILKVYDIEGREVKTLINTSLSAGEYTVRWDGTDSNGKLVTSGTYIYKLETEKFRKAQKLVLLK